MIIVVVVAVACVCVLVIAVLVVLFRRTQQRLKKANSLVVDTQRRLTESEQRRETESNVYGNGSTSYSIYMIEPGNKCVPGQAW